MPPKKKEKPTTCDTGTDPPPPVEYDPLNLDGRRLAEFKEFPELTRKALNKLKEQNTTGAPKLIKDGVVKELEFVIRAMEWYAVTLEATRTFSDRMQCIE